MLTAIVALLITSVVGGVFGSVATYTYIDSSEGKYCDKISNNNLESDEEFYSEDQQQNDDSEYNFSDEEDYKEY